MRFGGPYSVLLPGQPQTANQAAAQDFFGTPQTVLPELTVTGSYSDFMPNSLPDRVSQVARSPDLSPIVVTAQKMAMPAGLSSSMGDWLQPPKVFLLLGVLAVGGYFFMMKPRSRRKRR